MELGLLLEDWNNKATVGANSVDLSHMVSLSPVNIQSYPHLTWQIYLYEIFYSLLRNLILLTVLIYSRFISVLQNSSVHC